MSIGGYPEQQVEDWSSGQAETVEAEGEQAAGGLKSTTHTLMRWISLGDNQWVNLTFFIDPLTGVMLVTVTIVALMVVIYSIGYMR
ncbi:MAG: hypothetical protein IID33_04430, partial [Planctomycetes bacterium]|nr:hypothetical protein [Planctomycetota bacterium]